MDVLPNEIKENSNNDTSKHCHFSFDFKTHTFLKSQNSKNNSLTHTFASLSSIKYRIYMISKKIIYTQLTPRTRRKNYKLYNFDDRIATKSIHGFKGRVMIYCCLVPDSQKPLVTINQTRVLCLSSQDLREPMTQLLAESARSIRAVRHDSEFEDFNNKPKADEQVALTIASPDRLILPTNRPKT